MTKEGRHWPYLIVGSIIFMMLACVYTVYLSFDYPVDEDESYFLKYQEVEKNFAQIKQNEQEFLANFAFRALGEKSRLNITKRPAIMVDRELVLEVREKSSLKASDLASQVKLTRPHTSSEDRMLSAVYDEAKKRFVIDLGSLNKGRYTLLIHFKINDLSKFYKLELCKDTCKL